MANKKNILKTARQTITIEYNALKTLIKKLDNNFIKAVEEILKCKGRVVVTGVGKSGAIGRKITATLASTGTPAFFLHAAEGSHGDLGMVVKNDIVLALSYSGQTEELSNLLPVIKRLGVKLIAITGNSKSNLAKFADIVLNTKVEKEACPLGLAPTASTTSMLALGDALAVCLLELRNFKKEDFALFHPGGSLGKRLLLRIKDIMHKGEELPLVDLESDINKVIYEMSSKRLGITGVVDKKNKLKGCITDGDLRRAINKYKDKFYSKTAKELMTKNPKTAIEDALVVKGLGIMEKNKITVLFVKNKKNSLVGVVHMHDILQSGVV